MKKELSVKALNILQKQIKPDVSLLDENTFVWFEDMVMCDVAQDRYVFTEIKFNNNTLIELNELVGIKTQHFSDYLNVKESDLIKSSIPRRSVSLAFYGDNMQTVLNAYLNWLMLKG